ncbi:FimV/HubP family polar landmark protein [Wenzhouxiangella sp. EGI_FJ10305]|uniref:FimV/HubP family polar landmark protein n=1 Tax=Wenzhouxiangella sp. EGI_FJ10305 TaxID=3243768 RepID=UPI0035E2EAB7
MANNAVRLIAPVLLGVLMLLFPADGLRALGLGEARVDSWLGQPLDISIRLLDVRSDAVESVSVAPASLEDHERLGVPSDSLGLGLEVTVDRSTDPATVRVRSQRPVDDPVVQILIDARWSSGRVLREYTLFLDPPVRDSAAPVRDVSQPASRPASEPEPAERQERETAERAEEPASQPSSRPSQPEEESATTPSRAGDTVRVSRGDTLWRIAQDWRPDNTLSMDQVMLAIFNRNRGAFLGENINRLRSDALLDMPDVDEVGAVDRAEAERRVREHMRSWQPQMAGDAPVLSDAATPETPEPSAGADQDEAAEESAAQEETAPEEGAAETAESGEDYRLDVVPPEEDQYSETSAVSESEVQRVSQQLAEVEEEIAASDVESERFDEHVAEVRDALEQRDMAGVAVAEESLAELEDRLREAREARAEQDRLAQTADGEEAAGGEEGDEVTDYMRELEEEFGTQDEEASDAESGEMAAADEDDAGASGEAEDADTATDGDDEAMAAADESSTDSQATDEAGQAEQAEQAESSMPVTRSSGGMSGWLWPAVGLLALVIVAVLAVLWLRRRRQASQSVGGAPADDDAVDSARASVARRPNDLAAHLALLELLGDRGREQEFTDAFDQMYQEVDDESAPEWQEALSLASAYVPDHPLLTPHEAQDEDDDFDRRADEMIGMLDIGEADSQSDMDTDTDTGEREPGDAADEEFDLGMEEETREPATSETDDGTDGSEDSFDEDMDLAVLSERLDDPASETGPVTSVPADTEVTDFGEFEEDDESAEATEAPTDEHSEAPVEVEDEGAGGLDLDFTPAREQEADEVLGEAGTREDEDLDLELSSDVEDLDSTVSDDGLDFNLDETAETDSENAETAETAETEAFEWDGASESAEPSDGEVAEDVEASESSGGSLGDEDADVKLDLARAYISVDLADSARPVLEEVISDGSEEKQAEAQKLLDQLE